MTLKNTKRVIERFGLLVSPFWLTIVKLGTILVFAAQIVFYETEKNTLFLLLAALALTIFACNKNDSKNSSDGNAKLQVYLTDDPGNYDAVFIDVQDVRINYSSDTTIGWQSLAQVNRGSYDLLRLVNDRDTLLGNADVNSGRIEQIRLILGPNNYVRVNGQNYTLQTPSAHQSGLKLNIHQSVNAGVLYKLLMDFDVARSIVKTGNGGYILKPAIRTSLQAVGGSIRGFVLPSATQTVVYALRGTDTVTSTYTSNGAFFD
ncbi:MAG: hypothetical protein C4330_05775 [Chitinophagaceae bacterium]